MYPIFFAVSSTSGNYIYEEHGLQYEMPLLLMLQLKRFLREEASPYEISPVRKWHSGLQKHDLEKVFLKQHQY